MTSGKPRDLIILTGMPTKANTEIVAAAIAGFEEQKKRLDARITELRNMLAPSVPDGAARGTNERRNMSAAGACQNCSRSTQEMGRGEKAGWSSFAKYAHAKEAETEYGRTKSVIEATTRRWSSFRKAQSH